MGALPKVFVFAPQYHSVLLDITMDLYSLFAHVAQDEDPVDSIPTNDDTEGRVPAGCMIQ